MKDNDKETLQLEHHEIHSYKYKRSSNEKWTFNLTPQVNAYAKLLTPFEKTNSFTNRQHKFRLDRRVWVFRLDRWFWVGSQQKRTDWIDGLFQKQPVEVTGWIDRARVVESVCLKSLVCLVRWGFSQVQLIIYLKSQPTNNLWFFHPKRSLHQLS